MAADFPPALLCKLGPTLRRTPETAIWKSRNYPKDFIMCTATPCSPPSLAWHVLYHAALFEADRNMVPERIEEAERAILSRIKELFAATSDHIEEDVVLDDALYALRALRSCARPEAAAA